MTETAPPKSARFTLSALRAAVAVHLSPTVSERLEPMFERWGEGVDEQALSVPEGSDLLALALTGLPPEEAGAALERLTLRNVTAVSGGRHQTFAPSDVEYHPLADYIEPTFLLALRGPLWAGARLAHNDQSPQAPQWGQIELWKHEGRVFAGSVTMHFSDGEVILAYGEDAPAFRLCERQWFRGDALFFIGQVLHASADETWPGTDLAELTAAEAGAAAPPPADPNKPILH